jgi:acyl-homoserine-lactone acylase
MGGYLAPVVAFERDQMNRRLAVLAAGGVLVGAIGMGAGGHAAPASYDVIIARDSFGVPHITAADWGSLAFGQGHATAEDRACTVLDQMVKV